MRWRSCLLAALVLASVGVVSFAGAVDDTLYLGGVRLEAMQQDDGGWGWPLYDPANASPPNTIGPIAMGLARAEWNDSDPAFRDALEDAGGLLLTKTNNFSPSDGYLAVVLDSIFGGTTYRDYVTANFYGPLAAGTYNQDGAGTLYTTATYVQSIRDTRASQGIPNLAAWDVGMGLVGAAACGASRSAWIAGAKAEINELTSSGYYDVIGLAGALYGLAVAGETFDPTAGEHAAASSLADLADILASYQIAATGGFTWNANYVGAGDETAQETAYAILALNEVDRVKYLNTLQMATDWLSGFQLATGGWENYTGDPDGENNEVTGEAMWGIHAVYLSSVSVGPGGTDAGFGLNAVPFSTIERAISAIQGLGGTVNVAPGTYVEGPRVDIDGDVSIVGAGVGSTSVLPGGDTGTSGDARAWFLVAPDVTAYVQGIAFIGTGHRIYQGFRWKGGGAVLDCLFTDIQYDASGPMYNGVAIANLGDGNVDIIGCRFERIGRIGVIYFGSGVDGAVFSGNTYVGKGSGNWLDYGVEVGGGAAAIIEGNDITGNLGVASSDGSTSAAILVTDYYGPGTEAPISFNVLRGNTAGVAVGYLETDASVVTARYNAFDGNTWGITSTGPVVDAILNWWGSADGPTHASNPDGDGDPVSDHVIFSPWLGTNPDGSPSLAGVQITGPMLIVVDDVGPAPAGGYLDAAIGGSNSPELPYADTIYLHHGVYDGSEPITQPVTILSEPGSASHTTITGAMNVSSGNVSIGLPLQGLRINGDITVGAGVDASTVHVNWSDLYGSVANSGTGTMDAQYNYWGTKEAAVIDVRTTGLIDYDPYLPRNADDSYTDAIALLGSGLASTLDLAIEQLWAMDQLGQDAGTYIGYMGVAGAGAFKVAAPRGEITLGAGAGGGGAVAGAGFGTYVVGDPITYAFTLTAPATGKAITDAAVTVTLLGPDGGLAFWGCATYDETVGAYVFSIETSGLEPGTYELIIQADDGQAQTVVVVVQEA